MIGPTQTLFEALPPPGEPKTTQKLAIETGLSRKQVSTACSKLVDRGFVERLESGRFRMTETGELARKSGTKMTSGPNGPTKGKKPSPDSVKARLWRALRNLKKGTINDLISLAQKDQEIITLNTVSTYLRCWRLGGFVTILPRKQPGTALTSSGHKVYLLAQDPGPKVPFYRNYEQTVYDPNSEKIVWEAEL